MGSRGQSGRGPMSVKSQENRINYAMQQVRQNKEAFAQIVEDYLPGGKKNMDYDTIMNFFEAPDMKSYAYQETMVRDRIIGIIDEQKSVVKNATNFMVKADDVHYERLKVQTSVYRMNGGYVTPAEAQKTVEKQIARHEKVLQNLNKIPKGTPDRDAYIEQVNKEIKELNGYLRDIKKKRK